MAEKIKEGLYWIGTNNPDSKDFHGIFTPRGGSYNSCLIVDENPALIDITNINFFNDYFKSLKQIIEPEKIKYIIINHAEPDHCGAIKLLKKECINAEIVCTEKCKEFISEAFNVDSEYHVVKEGDEIKLGKNTLKFYPYPMVHWPETMITYMKEEKILFSGDLFGTEISHEKMFADEMEEYKELTRDYYAIVMRPYHSFVKKAIEKTKTLEIEMLIPSHGPVYRKKYGSNSIKSIVEYYEKLSTNPEENQVLILYYSIWHSTEKMAFEIARGIELENNGTFPVLIDIKKENLIKIMALALTSKAIAFGSLTLIGNYYALFDAVFSLLKANNQKGKKVILFGSYGWADAAIPKMKTKMEELEYEIKDIIKFRFGPKKEEDFKRLQQAGRELAKIQINNY